MRRALLIAIAALAAACTRADIVDIADGSGVDGAPRDGGVDAAAPDAGPGDAGCGYEAVDTTGLPEPDCTLTLAPGRPTCDEGSSGDDLFFAIRAFDFSVAPESGVDIDGYCTVSSDGPATCLPPDDLHTLDSAGSVDNAFGTEFITAFGFVYSMFFMGRTLEDDINATLESGFRNLTFRVRGWNGLLDDPVVEVAYINSACGRAMGDTRACPTRPTMELLDWTMDDNEFRLDEDAFVGGDLDTPVVRDTGAYVSDGVFVASLSVGANFALSTVNGDIPVRLTQVTILAELSPDGRVMTGTITGAWDQAGALLAPGVFGLCPGAPGYAEYENTVNRALDVRSTGTGGAMVPCDAMSVVVGFTAHAARIGALQPIPDGPDVCP